MLAGSSLTITDFDIWMMRDWWRNLASRYNLAAATVPAPAKTSTSTSAKATSTSTKVNVVVPATTSSAKPVTTTSKAPVAATTAPASGAALAAKYAQCGGEGWKGATACVVGSTCVVNNQWYSQCI